MKKFLSIIIVSVYSDIVFSQSDYLKSEQFKNFRSRRILVSNWQINQLADSGALIVRLKSNKKAIDILRQNQQFKLAKNIEQETYITNTLIVRAFSRHYNFSKLYFIYDYSSDSLIKGYNKGIFLDTNLQKNSNIEMKEKFYLIAEQDYIVQSSVGFVPEADVKNITETGAPVKQVAILIKNKYGHQLKHPFPFYVKGSNPLKYDVYVQKLVKNLKKFKEKNPRKEYPEDVKPFLY